MRTEHDVQADKFLNEFRMCIHAELVKEPECPAWIQFVPDLYDPEDEDSCTVCGQLHGQHYRVSLMRMDAEEMLEFDFWHAAGTKERPEESSLLACIMQTTFMQKDTSDLVDKFPEMIWEEATRLVNQSWEFNRFFSDEERLHLTLIS